MYDILMIFVEIFVILADFLLPGSGSGSVIEADPDPADQNETDPYGSGSATLLKRKT